MAESRLMAPRLRLSVASDAVGDLPPRSTRQHTVQDPPYSYAAPGGSILKSLGAEIANSREARAMLRL